MPPAGITVPDDVRGELSQQLADLQQQVQALRERDNPVTQQYLPDVEVFERAVDQALRFNEFFEDRDFEAARAQLKEGQERARWLRLGQTPWLQARENVVRGYRSKLDGTVQPYRLWIPQDFVFNGDRGARCDIWLHGRFEKTVELQFINQTSREIKPPQTIVLHPFGRFSNAFKFAGEVDVWEALAHARKDYRIDPDRIAIRGFSMGGAGCWQFTVHHPDRFFASTPGAGFSETPEFLKSFQQETLTPAPWEARLWSLYDCPGWANNLRMIPTIAYSGENDSQKQAADIMAAACGEIRPFPLQLTHLIGPGTGHQIHRETGQEIERRLQMIDRQPRAVPHRVSFTTFTLRYDRCDWVRIHGLEQHWSPARVDALLDDTGELRLVVENVNDLELHFDAGQFPAGHRVPRRISIGEARNSPMSVSGLPLVQSDRSWSCRIHLDGGEWKVGAPPTRGLRKKHGLQGPIDDAFMDSFLLVKPTGKSSNPAVDAWVEGELEHAITHWRQQMRGDARVKTDADLTAEDIQQHNIVLWGTPESNSVLARIAKQLPLQWSAGAVSLGTSSGASQTHVPVLVYPNPENPERYVVLNSSFTYREYDYLNNARQTPKLPDWALIDITTPPSSRAPGKVTAAGFFDESWQPGTAFDR